jgi:hypothetical protein
VADAVVGVHGVVNAVSLYTAYGTETFHAEVANVGHSPGDRRQPMNDSAFLVVGCVLILIGTVVTGHRKSLREEMTGSGLIPMGLGFLMIIYGLAAPG